MNYNLSDPNLDFDIEQEAIINALKGARADRQAEAPGFKTPAHWTANSGPLGGIGAAFTRLAGGLNERMAMDENRALSGEQRNRYDALQRELATPAPTSRTVLKQALQAGPTEEGGSLPDIQTQTQEQIPENEYRLAENQRRMGVAQQMSRLPMARGMADELWKKGIAFPEKMMELEAKHIEAGQRAAQTAADKEAQALRDEQMRRDIAAGRNATSITIAGMPARGGGARDRFQIAYGPDGTGMRINLDTGESTPLEGVAKPTKPPTSAQMKQQKINDAPAKIDSIMQEAKKNEESFGIVPAAASMLPNIVGSRVTSKVLNEDQKVAREKVMAQAAETIHELYGAALSRNEAGRADAWAVNPTDDYSTVMSKLRMAKEYAASRANKPSSSKYDDDKEARYQAWKAGQGK